MKLTFSWRESFQKLVPACEADMRNRDCGSLLCSLLTDSGGGHYSDALPWLEEGLRRVQAVQRGEVDSLEWARDAWAVRLGQGPASIYSLYDEAYAEDLDLVAFATALQAWTEFVKTPPHAGATRTINL